MDGLITHADLFLPGEHLPNATLEIRDGRIAALHPNGAPTPDLPVIHDAAGQRTFPGFIDIHNHGALGRDVCDGSPGALESIGRAKIREGVTTFLPTTLTIDPPLLRKVVQFAAPYMEAPTFAKAPCLHIEGPYINPGAVGAQNPAFVRPPDAAEIRALHEIAPIGIVSLAPEMEGSLTFIKEMRTLGITCSVAHTKASYAEYRAARDAGATHLTHFCNQMTPLHHREVGIVGAGLLDDEVQIELIADEIHLCPEMLALVFKHRSPERLMLVTDSMAASWMPEGRYELAELTVHVADGAARLESGALAGSTLAFHRGFRNVHAIADWPLEELVRTTGPNQARSLGLSGAGSLQPGSPADIVILDDHFDPVAVFVDGIDKLPAALADERAQA